MAAILNVLPFVSVIVVFIFAALVIRRYMRRHGTHLLVWGIGLVMYGIGSACESYHVLFGWNSLVFRVWYLTGAILVAAWLGQGTIYLLARRRWANPTMAILLLASVYAAFRVAGAELDPQRALGELTGRIITSGGVRLLTPFFNMYGTMALAGGAVYSAWLFWRKRILPNRVVGNALILLGTLAPALAGLFSRLGLTGYLYLGELVGAILLFVGFIRATTPSPQRLKRTE
jgi:hypothetical protein